MIKKSVELEPFSTYYNWHLGNRLTFAHQYDAAIQQYQRVLEIDPNHSDSLVWMGLSFGLLKKFEDAKNAGIRHAELTGGDVELSLLYNSLVEEHARTGEPVTPPPDLVKYMETWGWTTLLYAWLGHKDKTLELLEERGRYGSYVFMKYYPAFDFLRSEPRFIELLQKIERALEE